jgi:hypothetical protein
MFGAIISAGAALIGGNRARKHEKDERSKDRYMNSPEGIRKNAEKAGFNPLVFAGPGTGTGVGYAPTMGSSIANSWALAGEAIGGGISQKLAEKSQLTELQQENERLEKLAQRSILNPKVQGIYGNARHVGKQGSSSVGSGGARAKGVPASLGDSSRDDPYVRGAFSDLSKPVGSIRKENPPVDTTLQPISLLGMTLRGTGTTSSAARVEDNAGDVGGSLWGLPVAADYLVGTYSHNIGRPFASWLSRQSWPELPDRKTGKPKKSPRFRGGRRPGSRSGF